MRASAPDILRENIRELESHLDWHRKEFGQSALNTFMSFDLDEVRQLVDDLHEVLGQIEKEGDHGATTP